MTDNRETLDIEDLEYYVIAGKDRRTGEIDLMASSNLTPAKLGELMGRLTMFQQMQVVQLALEADRVQLMKGAQRGRDGVDQTAETAGPGTEA